MRLPCCDFENLDERFKSFCQHFVRGRRAQGDVNAYCTATGRVTDAYHFRATTTQVAHRHSTSANEPSQPRWTTTPVAVFSSSCIVRALMRAAIFALVLIVGLIFAPTLRAQSNATFVPSLSMSTVYDDNIFATRKGDAGVMTRLRPAFEGNYESPTVTLLSLYSFDMQHSNFPALNTFDARRHGSFELRHRTRPPTTTAT